MTADHGEIIIRLGTEIDRTVPLDTTVLTIGRVPDASITLQHPMVSRYHAELRVEPEGLVLTDVGSSNGTFIEGERLAPQQPQLLTSGMAFQIGPFQLVYIAATSENIEGQPASDAGEVDLAELAPAPPAQLIHARPPAPPRATYPVPILAGPRSSYLYDLPDIYQENDFLGRFLLIFETLWEPLEQRQDHIASYFDPHTAPSTFLPWLASWLDLALDPQWPESRLRDLLAEATDLYRWRGTRYGLSRLIEVCTGSVVQVTEDPGRPFVFEIHISVPEGSDVSDELISNLIRTHKPAHTGFVLEVVRP